MRQEALYTLRLWRDGERAEDWRASLKDLSTKEEQKFPSLEALCTHLRSVVGVGSRNP